MAQQYYNLYYAILPVKLSNMIDWCSTWPLLSFLYQYLRNFRLNSHYYRFELTEPKYKTKELTPYELCLIFCQIDIFPQKKI